MLNWIAKQYQTCLNEQTVLSPDQTENVWRPNPIKHCLVSKHADQMFIKHHPTDIQHNQTRRLNEKMFDHHTTDVWSCSIAKTFHLGQSFTTFDQMSDFPPILLNAIKHDPARSNKESKREIVLSLNNVWLCLIAGTFLAAWIELYNVWSNDWRRPNFLKHDQTRSTAIKQGVQTGKC